MFEFGRDLRRLFEKARDSDDLGWLELIGVGLVEVEARQQATDAGRVSCTRPFDAALRAAALWREHARRCGAPGSLERAESSGRDAARHAANGDQAVRAALDLAATCLRRGGWIRSRRRLRCTPACARGWRFCPAAFRRCTRPPACWKPRWPT